MIGLGRHVFGRPVLLGLVTACGVVFLAGAAARPSRASTHASPVFRVAFSFSSVSKSRPPNIVEIRRVGKGSLSFNAVPSEAETADADQASGTIVYEADVLTPHPSTERFTFSVTGGSYLENEADSGAITNELASLTVKVTTSTLAACDGAVGKVALEDIARLHRLFVGVRLSCGEATIHEGQYASTGRNSRIQLSFFHACLRTTSAAGKPLCGPKAPTKMTLAAAGLTCSMYLVDVGSFKAGQEYCNKAPVVTPGQAPAWYVDVNKSATVTLTASLDTPLPAGSDIVIDNGGTQLCKTTTANTCTATLGPFPTLTSVYGAEVNAGYETSAGGIGPYFIIRWNP